MNLDADQIWARALAQLALIVDEPTHRLWLSPLEAAELRGEHLLLHAPAHTCRWVQDRFGRVIQSSVELVLGPGASVEVVSLAPGRPGGADASPARSAPPAPAPAEGPLRNPKLTFDQFVIGDCNRLAHAAALTVAEMPAHAYNPLFICGPPGTGKTHLLAAIANLLVTHDPGICVRAATGESFTNQFLAALGEGRTDAFKARFRDVDVLLVDDVQFFERKARTEEEFFHTFNALHDGGRQIVLTSDRPPRDLQALEDRLRERFEAGLVADIQAPDRATRLAILRKRVHQDDIQLEDPGALEQIADHITANVRTLEGALIRVVAYSSLTRRPLSAELAHEVLTNLYPPSAQPGQRRHTVADVKAGACSHFGITDAELVSSSRSPRLAGPRQLAMYLARELTEASLPAIGREFGGRDHSTVLYACRRAATRVAEDPSCQKAVENIQRSLEAGAGQLPDRPS